MRPSINSNPDSAPVSTCPPPDRKLQLIARFRAVLKNEDVISLALAIMINAALFGLVFTFGTSNYDTNDDSVMQGIASGIYSGHPDEHLIFTSVIIGRVLRFLYEAWPNHNWYRAYLVGVHFAALTAIAFVIFRRCRTRLFIFLYTGFFVVLEVRVLLLLQFTTTAFIAGAAGVLLLVDGLQPGRLMSWPRVLAGLVFTTVMAMVRQPVAPFLLLVSIPFLIERLVQANWKRVASVGIAAVALCFAVAASNHWYYEKDKAWSEYMEFNSLRGGFQGTPLAGSALQTAPRAGWSVNDVVMFKDFYGADPEIFGSVPRLRAFIEKARTLFVAHSRRIGLRDLFFLPGLLGEDPAAVMELGFLNGVWCVLAAGALRRRCAIALLASFGMYTALGFVLMSTARLPERVSHNMGLFANLICLYWASGFVTGGIPDFSRGSLRRWWDLLAHPLRRWSVIVIVFVMVCEFGLLAPEIVVRLGFVNSYNLRIKEVSRQIFEPVRNLLPGGKPILVALPRDSTLELCTIYYPAGQKVPFSLVPQGWLMQSPIFFQMLEQHGLVPYSLSLLDRPDVFFLMEPRWILPLRVFYKEHYGREVSFKQVLNTDVDPKYAGCRLHVYQVQVITRANGPPAASPGA